MQISQELSGKMSSIQDRRVKKVIGEAFLTDTESGKKALQEEIANQQKMIEGLTANIKGQKKVVDELNTTWRAGTGNKILAEEQANLSDLEQKLQDAKGRVQQLEEAMGSMGKTAGEAAAQAAEGVAGVAQAPARAADGFVVGDGKDSADKVREAQTAAVEAKTPGFKGIQDLLQSGADPSQLRAYLDAVDTAPGSLDRGLAAGGELSRIQASGGFQSQEQLDAFAQKIAQATQTAIEGEEKRIELAEQAKQALASSEPVIADIKTSIAGLSKEGAATWGSALQNIQDRFASGKMSAEEFTGALKELKSATDQAAAAEKKEAEAKLRKQILAGNFSGLNVQQALEDRLFSMRMQQFNNGVDAMFNSMMGLSNAVQPVADGFNQLGDRMDQFGQSMMGAMPGADAGSALNNIMGFLSSDEGMRASLVNNIALLQQSLQVIQDPRRRQDVINQISNLQNQMQSLNSTPYVTSISGEYAPSDPAAKRSSGGGNTYHLSFPNISRVTNSDVRMLTDEISRELDRRGRKQ
jgi:hypothetical protein